MAVKKSTKAKATSIAAAQSGEQADSLVKQYGDTYNELAHLQADLDEEIAALKERYQDRAKPLQESLNAKLVAVQTWAEANREKLTEGGKIKTVRLGNGEIGWRVRPPSVRLKKGFTADMIVETCKKLGINRFVRTKLEPNKEAMLAEPEAAKLIDGISIGSAGEDFFLVPFGAEIAEAKE